MTSCSGGQQLPENVISCNSQLDIKLCSADVDPDAQYKIPLKSELDNEESRTILLLPGLEL
jgi:hypothetical protein